MFVIKNLSLIRNEKTIFQNINCALEAGSILQIQGQNGAGKTSLLRILAGLINPSEGEIFWQQQLINQQREDFCRALLYLGHTSSIRANLTVYENIIASLQLAAKNDLAQIIPALEYFNLQSYRDTLVQYLSAGQQKRVALSRLFLLSSPLWVLDEPFSAIDQNGVQLIENLLLNHAQRGGIVIFTSHQAIALNYSQIQTLYLS